ncbi:proteasome inhibitor PI31 subunit isoform X2 [Copidosoma floridanum]|uniref:proteasome inhibitor PI31 subunit isoform X2 n=1 Tax=Copidosoma floridanum TaxID=29053 RepID=UPI0006C9C44B|nr:proteasome inhibitor PI31 subunit isoform X2 [Copidosoma floridanum]
MATESTSSTTDTFGFELIHKLSASQINKKEDVLVLLVHWHLVKNGFKCLGSGDATIGPSEEGSELLPEGWSQELNYSLRYIKEAKLYILMAVKSDNDLIFNFLKVESHAVSNVQFPIDTVKALQGPLAVLVPDYEQVLNSLKINLIEPVSTGSGVEVSTQTSESQTNRPRRDPDDDPLRVGPPHRPIGQVMPGHPLGPANPFDIGRDDLDPFRQGRGGMLFDPFSRGPNIHPSPGIGIPGRLPRGSVPPGARFDPFGPLPDDFPHNRRNPPDGDHFPPPGNYDAYM